MPLNHDASLRQADPAVVETLQKKYEAEAGD